MITPPPSDKNQQRAREMAQQIIEYLSVVPDVAIADCCHDHSIGQILEVLIPELSAKDAEIERLKDERLQIQRALASTVCEDPTEDDHPPYTLSELTHGITSLDERRRAAVKRAATARADAIRECATALHQLEAPDYDHGVQANGFEDGKVAAIRHASIPAYKGDEGWLRLKKVLPTQNFVTYLTPKMSSVFVNTYKVARGMSAAVTIQSDF